MLKIDKYRLDDDGNFWYAGRSDDMFIIRGVNVFPSQVEAALLTVEETVERIAAVTPEEIRSVAALAYTAPYVIGAVGPFGADDLEAYVR